MRRYVICLLYLFLMPAWSERKPDVASSSKGLTTNTCGNNPAAQNPYSNKRFSLGELTGTTTSGTTYVATVDIYAWGEYNCSLFVSGNSTSGEDPATEDTILAVTIATPAGAAPAGSYNLVSFRLNNYLPVSQALSFISCNPAGVTPCDNQSEDDYSPVPEPAPISGSDSSGSLWTFGDIFQLSGVTTGPTPTSPPIQLSTTPPELAAALLVPGCAPDPSRTPPQTCIGSNAINYGNGLSPQSTFTVAIQDIASGQILVLGTPPSVQATPGKGHDVFSMNSYNPVSITTSIFSDQIYDLSANYPQLDGTGKPTFNGFAPSAFPSPCVTNAGICTADDSFANASYHAMWFDFVPPTNNPVSVNTAHSHYDTILSVFTGAANGLQAVANGLNDDNPSATIAQGPRSSAVTFMGIAGVTYHILVSEYPPLDPSPDPGFDLYEAPLSSDPILYLTLTTPQLTSSPSALTSFGSVIQGASSTPQAITLAAAYSAGSSGISNILPSMAVGSADFAIASDSTCLSSLADQATCTLNIVFTPSTTGARNGTLTVNSSAENSPLTFSLSGTGLQATPVLSLATTPLSFGSQLLNTSSGTNSLVLTNSGSAPLTVFGVSASGDFSQTNNCSSLAVGGQCSIAVTFTPTQSGSRTGKLSITDNVAGSPQQIQLSGTGTDFALQPASGGQLSATVAAGGTATYNLAATPISGFTGVVALSCSGTPAGSTCTPSTNSVNLDGSPVSITLAVTTPATSALSYPAASWAVEAALVIPLGFIAGYRRRKVFLGMICFVLLLFLSSCGGGGNSTTGGGGSGSDSSSGGTTAAATSTLTLSGVSGTQTRSVALTLTVQ